MLLSTKLKITPMPPNSFTMIVIITAKDRLRLALGYSLSCYKMKHYRATIIKHSSKAAESQEARTSGSQTHCKGDEMTKKRKNKEKGN